MFCLQFLNLFVGEFHKGKHSAYEVSRGFAVPL
jgi:hypothetical protein